MSEKGQTQDGGRFYSWGMRISSMVFTEKRTGTHIENTDLGRLWIEAHNLHTRLLSCIISNKHSNKEDLICFYKQELRKNKKNKKTKQNKAKQKKKRKQRKARHIAEIYTDNR